MGKSEALVSFSLTGWAVMSFSSLSRLNKMSEGLKDIATASTAYRLFLPSKRIAIR